MAVLVLREDPAQQRVADRVLGLGHDHQRRQLSQARRLIRRLCGGQGRSIAKFLILTRRGVGCLGDAGFIHGPPLGRCFGRPFGSLGCLPGLVFRLTAHSLSICWLVH